MKTLAFALTLAFAAAGAAHAQTPPTASAPANPAHEALLRATIESTRNGTVDYSTMVPALAEAARGQEAPMKNLLQRFGDIQTIEHVSSENGEDVYLVRFAQNVTRWTIATNGEGKISRLLFRPAQ